MSPRNEFSKVISGFLLVLGMHVVFVVTVFLLLYLFNVLAATFDPSSRLVGIMLSAGIYSIFWIGLTQLLYVIPTLFFLKRRQRFGIFKGVVIGAVVTALLSGGCWLLVTSQ